MKEKLGTHGYEKDTGQENGDQVCLVIFAGANDLVEEYHFKVEHAARVNCAPELFGLVKIFTYKRDQNINAIFLEVVSVEWFHADYGTKKYETE